MNMDTQQWIIKAVAVAVCACIPLSVVGVTVMAVTHDGSTIQQAFDYFNQLIQFAIPAAGAVTGLHIWTQRTTTTSTAATNDASTTATGEGTAGA